MEKIKFEEPMVEIFSFAAVDIITTSPFEGFLIEFEEVPLP